MFACVSFFQLVLNRDEHISHYYDALRQFSANDRKTYLNSHLLFLYFPLFVPVSLPTLLSTSINPCTTSLDLAFSSYRTSTYQCFFHYAGTTMQNSLPITTRKSKTLSIKRVFSVIYDSVSQANFLQFPFIFHIHLYYIIHYLVFSFFHFYNLCNFYFFILFVLFFAFSFVILVCYF